MILFIDEAIALFKTLELAGVCKYLIPISIDSASLPFPSTFHRCTLKAPSGVAFPARRTKAPVGSARPSAARGLCTKRTKRPKHGRTEKKEIKQNYNPCRRCTVQRSCGGMQRPKFSQRQGKTGGLGLPETGEISMRPFGRMCRLPVGVPPRPPIPSPIGVGSFHYGTDWLSVFGINPPAPFSLLPPSVQFARFLLSVYDEL